MVRSHPAVPYQPDAGPDSWRWGSLPEGTALRVEQLADRSRIELPTRRRAVSVVGPIFGFLFLAGAAALFVKALFGEPPLFLPRIFSLSFPLVPAAIGMGALYADNHVVAVDLSRTEVAVTVSYGAVLMHRVVLPRRLLLAPSQITGAVQSGWTMDTDQERPEYRLRVAGQGLLRRDRRFVLHVDPTDGAWIAEGLRYWTGLRP